MHASLYLSVQTILLPQFGQYFQSERISALHFLHFTILAITGIWHPLSKNVFLYSLFPRYYRDYPAVKSHPLKIKVIKEKAPRKEALCDTDVSISKLSFPKGRHRRFPRYPIVHLPCPVLSGVRHSRSESVLSSDQVYHNLRFRCKLAAFTELLSLPLSLRWKP